MDNSKLKVLKLKGDKILGIKKIQEKCFVPIGTDREKIYLDGHLWHVFSYKVRECERCEQAIKKFNEIPKDNLFIFYQRKDIGYVINKAKVFTDEDMRQFITDFESSDIYATDEDFNWTFVITHEDGWLGPYFCKRLIVS